MKPAIFLDKDGVIVDNSMFPKPPRADILPQALEGLTLLGKSGIPVIVVSNQSWISRGTLKKDEVEGIFMELHEKSSRLGLPLKWYYCPHSRKEACACRKPEPGMLLQAAKDLNIDLSRSYMVGDQTCDILTGKKAGVTTILVKTGRGGKDGEHEVEPDHVAHDLTHAVRHILSRETR